MNTASEVLARLRTMGSERDRQGMSRFGINVDNALGVSIYELRNVAREIGTDHQIAAELWKSGYHEARILAGFIEDPAVVSDEQMERWVSDFNSWDLCDQVCGMFEKTQFARDKIHEWSRREEEFVKRAAFAMIAGLAIHDKKAPDHALESFFDLIIEQSTDRRNFVKKAVIWALRNIGKRNRNLNRRAVDVASRLMESDDRTARWIGSNAHRELTSEKVQARLEHRKSAKRPE